MQSQRILLFLGAAVNIGSINEACQLIHLVSGAKAAISPRGRTRPHKFHAGSIETKKNEKVRGLDQ